MKLSPTPKCLRQVAILISVFSSCLFGQDEAPKPDPQQLEEAAAVMQAADQKIAKEAIPFVSGFVFLGLDPERPNAATLAILHEGGVSLSSGAVTTDEANYAFSGKLLDAPTGFANPINRMLLLGIIKWLAISAVAGWPFVAFVLRGTVFEEDRYDATVGSLFFRLCGWMANLLVLLTMMCLYLLAVRRPAFWPGAASLQLVHLVPVIGALAIALALSLLGSLVAWAKRYWRVPGRIHYTVTVISGVAFLWFLHHRDVLSVVFEKYLG